MDVFQLQSDLISLSFDPGTIDGSFGPLTMAAVLDWATTRGHLMPVNICAVEISREVASRLTPSRIGGLDVSGHNGAVDWRKVAESGDAKFCWVKLTEGTSKQKSGEQNLNGCRAFGIPVGGYHFARPDSHQSLRMKDAEQEAKAFLRAYGTPQPDDLTAALDLESGLLKQDHSYNVEWAIRWCEVVEAALGSPVLIYTGKPYIDSRMRKADPSLLAELVKRPLWFANYARGWDDKPNGGEADLAPWKSMNPWSKYAVWQWTGGGQIPGVERPRWTRGKLKNQPRCDRNWTTKKQLEKLTIQRSF